VRVLPCGSSALLVELGTAEETARVHAGLAAAPPYGVEELVPAAVTVLVRFDPSVTTAEQVATAVRSTPARDTATAVGASVEIPVQYDGDDLDDVARLTGLSVEEVVARHRAATYRVAFCGFAPGFAYLTGLPAELHVPRLSTPRTSVPAGAVAVAGEYAAVYPRASPGGWRLLGRTELTMWDLARDPPALLVPGATVRFV
jgi:KipI family sensor histidine kinase inhibitor